MKNLNSIIIEGNLVRDVELKYSASGTAIAQSCLAVHTIEKKGDGYEETVSFIDFTAFGKKAETINNNIGKGSKVIIHGELKQNRWTNKEGVVKSRFEVIVDSIYFRDKIGGNQNGEKSETNK